MKKRVFLTIWILASGFGLIFVAAGISCLADGTVDVGGFIAGIIVGLTCCALGAVPFLTTVSKERAQRAKEEKERIRLEAEKKEAAEKPKLCPQCGASTKGLACEYCGAPLGD